MWKKICDNSSCVQFVSKGRLKTRWELYVGTEINGLHICSKNYNHEGKITKTFRRKLEIELSDAQVIQESTLKSIC